MKDFAADTIPIDVNFLGRPQAIAACLLRSPSALAVIDPGPESTLPALRAGLAAQGVSVGDLDAILLTQIHFDHAGARHRFRRRYGRHPHRRAVLRDARHAASRY